MITVGITGGIGSGKSIVSKILTSLNYPVFNSDLEAKQIIETNSEVRSKIISYFGESSYSNGHLNREFIASRIFVDDKAMLRINEIVHPAVRIAFKEFSNQQSNSIIFNEAAILFETGAYSIFDKTILVTAPEKTRIDRVVSRDEISKSDVITRMKKQWTDEKKMPLADFVIVNDESIPLIAQVEEIIEELSK